VPPGAIRAAAGRRTAARILLSHAASPAFASEGQMSSKPTAPPLAATIRIATARPGSRSPEIVRLMTVMLTPARLANSVWVSRSRLR